MPTAKKGIDSILLFRVLKTAASKAAAKLAFQTEHSTEKSRDTNTQQTKDGLLQSLGGLEVTLSATSIMAESDPLVEELEKAMDNGDLVEIWEIEKGAKQKNGKFSATYYQGYLTSFNKTKNSEDLVELEMEFGINGVGAKGEATLTEGQAEVVQYKFADTTAGSVTTETTDVSSQR
ncbi:phage major tail protein, TP901-1 family [Streptococcus hillyeri]|uniref:Phage major tail protein, TP901-1 family n=1 Tax=Streptococcus hillyeri TaxID=2282420 RepID=A0A3L9DQ88_9STRE|nr:phage major tail protein, TP901-1 family [Streptococcus hillyeri]RLY03075.1 phage major tail protein, TP901-1 family [Streptococcus hillyeri]